MPRKRKGDIKESIAELLELEKRCRKDAASAARVRMLRVLQEQPETELADVAGTIGYSQQTVKRWLKTYRDGGIEALLQIRSMDAQGNRNDGDLDSLRAGLASGSITCREDVVAWLKECRTSVSSPKSEIQEDPVESVSTWKNGAKVDANNASKINEDSNGFLNFVNSLPVTSDVKSWVEDFRQALGKFLGDVCRISIGVNLHCELQIPEDYRPNLVFVQGVSNKENKRFETLERYDDDAVHVNRSIESLERTGFPFEAYQPPHSFTYYLGGTAYLGVVMLWREVGKLPISDRTLSIMDQIQPFIIFLLSDVVARFKSTHPVDKAFFDSWKKISENAGLTQREQRVVILQILGMTYNEMAATLHISPNTLRYHLKSIYRKTETHSQAELIARFFAPAKFVDKSHP